MAKIPYMGVDFGRGIGNWVRLIFEDGNLACRGRIISGEMIQERYGRNSTQLRLTLDISEQSSYNNTNSDQYIGLGEDMNPIDQFDKLPDDALTLEDLELCGITAKDLEIPSTMSVAGRITSISVMTPQQLSLGIQNGRQVLQNWDVQLAEAAKALADNPSDADKHLPTINKLFKMQLKAEKILFRLLTEEKRREDYKITKAFIRGNTLPPRQIIEEKKESVTFSPTAGLDANKS